MWVAGALKVRGAGQGSGQGERQQALPAVHMAETDEPGSMAGEPSVSEEAIVCQQSSWIGLWAGSRVRTPAASTKKAWKCGGGGAVIWREEGRSGEGGQCRARLPCTHLLSPPFIMRGLSSASRQLGKMTSP